MLAEPNEIPFSRVKRIKPAKNKQSIINVQNAALFYRIANIIRNSLLAKHCSLYIDRTFTMFADSKNFLQLDLASVAKILSSSGLSVTSEIEVFNAADAWAASNGEFAAEYLLLKVRLPLLSKHALRHLSTKRSSFSGNASCVEAFKDVLQNKKMKRCANRHCDQRSFDIVVCGAVQRRVQGTIDEPVRKINADDMTLGEDLPRMAEARKNCQAVCVRNEIFVFGGRSAMFEIVPSVERFSSGRWEKVAEMQKGHGNFCACSLMGNVYVIGGDGANDDLYDCCLEFDVGSAQWKRLARMREEREFAACAVFRGKIVVSGGRYAEELDTVEEYDHVCDEWTRLPSMVHCKMEHKMAAVRDKLFVVGPYDMLERGCIEVFDGEKFALVKRPPIAFEYMLSLLNDAMLVANELVLFGNESPEDKVQKTVTLIYNVDRNEWYEKSYTFLKGLVNYTCTLIPQF